MTRGSHVYNSHIIDRLKLDVSGPPIHIDYYRQDAADALAEIQRLRQTLAAFIKQ